MYYGESDVEVIAWLMAVFQKIKNKLNKNVKHSKSLSHYKPAYFPPLKAFTFFCLLLYQADNSC